jgi:hypothetical protein
MVPDPVIGPPEVVNPVAPPDTFTDETVPPPVPPIADTAALTVCPF